MLKTYDKMTFLVFRCNHSHQCDSLWKQDILSFAGKTCMHRIPLSCSLRQVSSLRSMRRRVLRHCTLLSCLWPQVWCFVRGSSGSHSIGNNIHILKSIQCFSGDSTPLKLKDSWQLEKMYSTVKKNVWSLKLWLRLHELYASIFKLIVVSLPNSGYDFGYLIKILSNSKLPEEEVDFFEVLRLFFPIIYDVKYLMKSCKNLKVFSRLEMCMRMLSLEIQGLQSIHDCGLFYAVFYSIESCCFLFFSFFFPFVCVSIDQQKEDSKTYLAKRRRDLQ